MTRPATTPNHQLRAARKALVSPSGSGRPLSRQELAAACNSELAMWSGVRGKAGRWAGFTERTIGALERGEIRWPNSEYRDALCAVLKVDARGLGLYIDRQLQVDDENEPRFAGMIDFADSTNCATAAAHVDAEQLLGWSVEQSADQALSFAVKAASGLDAQTISDLFEQVGYIACEYASEHRWQTFIRAQSVRDVAFDFSGQTRRPGDLSDAYLLASVSSLLMSSAAFDLAHPSAARRLAQAARTMAGLSRHAEAEAWAIGLLATLLNWQNRPERALTLLEQGRREACTAVGLHRLDHIAARSHALLGDRRATGDALTEALRHFPGNDSGGLLQDEIGGEFRFEYARASACAGTAWLHVGDGVSAKRHLCDSLDAYQALPAAQRPWAPVNGARVDLAAALVLAGDLDGASEAMEPIFRLPETRRISTISGRLKAVRSQLRKPQHKRDAIARRLDDRIDQWTHSGQSAPDVR